MPAAVKLEWGAQARADLLAIVAYIAEDNPDAAQVLKDEVEAKAGSSQALQAWSHQGRAGNGRPS